MTSKLVATENVGSPPRLILENLVSLSASGAADRLLSMFAGIFVRRALGPGPIGMVSWAIAIASYPALLVNAGFGVIAKRDVARQPHTAAHYTSLVLTLQLLLALLTSSIVVIISFMLDQPAATKWLVGLQAISLLLIPLDFTWLLHSRERMVALAFLTLINASIRTVLLILLVRNPGDMFIYAVIAYPFQLGASVFQIVYSQKHDLVDWHKIRATLKGARRLLVEALPIGLSSISIMLYYNSDVLILGATRSSREVGLYATAYSLMLVPGMLTGAIVNTYFPALARTVTNPDEARRISLQFLRGLVWLGFPIAALGWSVGRFPVVLLYGHEYAEAGVYFEWLCLNIALMFFNVGCSQPLNAWGAQKLLFYCTTVAGLMNLSANLILLPQFGLPAAIGTTIMAELVVMVLALAFRRSIFPIPWLKPVTIAGLVCGVAALMGRGLAELGLWWLGGIAVVGIVFAGILLFERDTVATVSRILLRRGATS